MNRSLLPLALLPLLATPLRALDQPGTVFKVFQFPQDKIPHMDGNADDWAIVPDSYSVGTNELRDDTGKHKAPAPDSLDVKVRVGWVPGLSRLYFLYEATDNYWDFSLPGLKNDTFEIVVDGDASGGPLIGRFRANPDAMDETQGYFNLQGTQAQNYHIFTPHEGKDWAMYWGPQQWVKAFPWAQSAQQYDFKPGEGGHYTLEFYITVFDYCSPDGPDKSAQSTFSVDKIIGLCWAIIDYDDVNSKSNNGFWNLSSSHTMYGQASELRAFRLMPLEPSLQPGLKAGWTFDIVDRDRRVVAFKDQSTGDVKEWHWDFGDGTTSDEQFPIHTYAKGDHYVVVLRVKDAEGKTSRFSRVWDVTLP